MQDFQQVRLTGLLNERVENRGQHENAEYDILHAL